MASEPDWRAAEAGYTDEVTGEGTLPGLFEASAARNAEREAQWYKGGVHERSLTPDVVPAAPDGEYAALTYAEMRGVVRNVAAGVRELGLEPGDRVGVFADTRMEWAHVDFGVQAAGGVVTTVFPAAGPDQVAGLLGDAEATGVVVADRDRLERVQAVADRLDLEWIAVMDELPAADRTGDVLTLAELHERGREAFDPATYEQWLGGRDPGDLATLVYTAGTSGDPLGVELTHRNLRANVTALRKRFGPRPDKDETLPTIDVRTRTLSFLPLAHVFERTVGHFGMFAAGATVAYAEGPETVAADVRAVEPTTATAVPAVSERIAAFVSDRARESAVGGRTFRWAAGVARRYARADRPSLRLRAQHRLADRLVYEQVAEQLGGELRFLLSAGGSLDPDLAALFAGMGLPVLEGYGITEASPLVSIDPPEDVRPGTLGVPLDGVDVRLDDAAPGADPAPTADGEVGELLVRGPSVTGGYWERPEATEATVTEVRRPEADGPERWFRTGDVVERTPEDHLVFHHRLADQVVLADGDAVDPHPIEAALTASDRVAQALVLGDGESYLSALLVPDVEVVERWAEATDVDLPADRAAMVDDERVRDWFAAAIEDVNADLAADEQIRRFELCPVAWTGDNGLLTPTLRKRRGAIRERFAERIDRIYETAPPEAVQD